MSRGSKSAAPPVGRTGPARGLRAGAAARRARPESTAATTRDARSARGTAAKSGPAGARQRLSPDERRRQLIQSAASLMTRGGVDAVQMGEVAEAAGVTRQLVYNFFPNRRALLVAVLEDFIAELAARFGRGFVRSVPMRIEDSTRLFVEAVCDTIEARGSGPWELLHSKGPDPEIARRGRELQDELVAPWYPSMAEFTGASRREVVTACRMLVAAGRAVFEQWYNGEISREEAVRDTTRGVSALIQAFSKRR